MSEMRPLIVGIGGTPRPLSSSERALSISLAAAREQGADVIAFSGSDLILPMYPPTGTERTPQALKLVDALRRCCGVIIAAPSYHGSMSGLIKNALDYAEDLRTDERVYLDGVAVGCIVCAGGWQAAGQTLSALRAIAHALRGWPTPLGAMLNTSGKIFDEGGNCLDLTAKMQLEVVGRQVGQFAMLQNRPVRMGTLVTP